MSLGAAIAGGVIAGVGNLAGGALTQRNQKDLMDYNAALNLEQWNRENAYNSPAAQMARLREAGLNPDLAIGGNVANTAGHADMTSGTPHAPYSGNLGSSVMSAVSQGVQLENIESQTELNRASAEEHAANAGKTVQETNFLVQTFETRVTALLKANEAKDAEIAELNTTVAKLNADIEYVRSVLSPLSRSQMRLNDFQSTNYASLTRLNNANAEMQEEFARNSKAFVDSEMAKIISEANLNNATASKMRADTQFLLSSMEARLFASWVNPLMSIAYGRYMDALTNLTGVQMLYYPIQMVNDLIQYEGVVERDAKGNVKMVQTPYGQVPKMRDAYWNTNRALEVAGKGVSLFGGLADSYMKIGFGTSAFGQFSASKAAISASRSVERGDGNFEMPSDNTRPLWAKDGTFVNKYGYLSKAFKDHYKESLWYRKLSSGDKSRVESLVEASKRPFNTWSQQKEIIDSLFSFIRKGARK